MQPFDLSSHSTIRPKYQCRRESWYDSRFVAMLTVDILSTVMLLMGYEHIYTKTVMTCTLLPASGQTFCIVTFLALFKINNMSSNIFQTFILWGWITFLSPVQTKESEHTGMNLPLSARLKPASQIVVTSTGYVQLARVRTLTTSLIWHPSSDGWMKEERHLEPFYSYTFSKFWTLMCV